MALAATGAFAARAAAAPPVEAQEPPWRLELDAHLERLELPAIGGSVDDLTARGALRPRPGGELAVELHVSIARIDAGLAVTDAGARLQLRRDGRLAIESAEARFAGGRLHTQGAVDFDAPFQELVLHAEGLRLEELLELAGVSDLSGTGRIRGELPLVLRDGELSVQDARLRAAGGGRLRYRPTGGGETALSRVEGAGVLLEALRDFHYEELEAAVSGDLRGRLDVDLHVAGANPDYREGQPVELNLGVDFDLGGLLRARELSERVPEEIERRIERRREEGP